MIKINGFKYIMNVYASIVNHLKENNYDSIGVFIFAFYILTQRWFATNPGTGILQMIVVFSALLLLLFNPNNKNLFKQPPTILEAFWFIGILTIIIYIFLAGISSYSFDAFIYIVGFSFLFLAKMDIEKYRGAFLLIKYFSIIYSLSTIMQFFFTDTFNGFIFNFINLESQTSIIELNMRNYFPGFGLTRTAIGPGFMALGIGLIFLFWDYNDKRKYYCDLILLLILFFGLILAGKLSIILWTFFALVITYIISRSFKEKYKRLCVAGIILSICILSLFVILYNINSMASIIRLEQTIISLLTGELPSTWSERLQIFSDAWAMISNNLLYGVGWKQFIILTSGMYTLDYHVHNLFLQLLCEMGVIGLITISLPLIYTYAMTYKVLKALRLQNETINSLWGRGLAFAFYYQTLFLLLSMTDNPFYETNYILMYFLIISITNAYLALNTIDVGND